MEEQAKKEFIDLCEHIMERFKSILTRVDGTSQVLDVIALSEGEKNFVKAFVGGTMKSIQDGNDHLLTGLLSTFCMGVLFGQEGRGHIGELQ